MGVLTDIFISDTQDAAGYDSTHAHWSCDRLQHKSISPLELSTLWAIMRQVTWDVGLIKGFQCVFVKDGGERVIHKLPAGFTAELLTLSSEQIQQVASQWTATDEMGWPVESARHFIEELSQLARGAAETEKNVYIWNCV
jgi:hypothetical protein